MGDQKKNARGGGKILAEGRRFLFWNRLTGVSEKTAPAGAEILAEGRPFWFWNRRHTRNDISGGKNLILPVGLRPQTVEI